MKKLVEKESEIKLIRIPASLVDDILDAKGLTNTKMAQMMQLNDSTFNTMKKKGLTGPVAIKFLTLLGISEEEFLKLQRKVIEGDVDRLTLAYVKVIASFLAEEVALRRGTAVISVLNEIENNVNKELSRI